MNASTERSNVIAKSYDRYNLQPEIWNFIQHEFEEIYGLRIFRDLFFTRFSFLPRKGFPLDLDPKETMVIVGNWQHLNIVIEWLQRSKSLGIIIAPSDKQFMWSSLLLSKCSHVLPLPKGILSESENLDKIVHGDKKVAAYFIDGRFSRQFCKTYVLKGMNSFSDYKEKFTSNGRYICYEET